MLNSNSGELNGNNERAEKAEPRLTYSERLADPLLGYNIKADPVLIGTMLRDHGVSEQDIGTLEVVIDTGSSDTYSAYAEYDKKGKQIIVYANRLWRDYVDATEETRKIVAKKPRSTNALLAGVTESLHESDSVSSSIALSSADGELQNETAEKLEHELLSNAKDTLLHESRHYIDQATGKVRGYHVENVFRYMMLNAIGQGMTYGEHIILNILRQRPDIFEIEDETMFVAALTGLLIQFSFRYEVDKNEISARKFAADFKGDPKYDGMIVISPKTAKETMLGRLAESGYVWNDTPMYGYEGYLARKSQT